MTYYNTTKEEGHKLDGFQRMAATQDQKIADFFEQHPGEIFTPWEIQSLVFTHTPITSVRRSINDLTKAGILDKTEHMKESGRYGRRSYAWVLNESYRDSVDQMEIVYSEAPIEPLLLEIDQVLGPVTDPQGILFEVAPMEPVNCSICGRELTHPHSIKAGVGPVCATKCEKP